MEWSIRRFDRAMSEAETLELLEKSSVGRIGTCLEGIPYITPVNYVFHDDCVYFHCALEGRKLENIRKNKNVCFEVDELVSIIQHEIPCHMSANYKSVIIFGEASIIDNDDVKVDILKKIVEKYSKDKSIGQKLKKDDVSSIIVVRIKPVTITGKKSVKYGAICYIY